MKKVFVVNNSADCGKSYYLPFQKFGKETNSLDDLNEASLVVFTGGADVSADFYNEPPHPETYCNPKRDHQEKEIFLKSFSLKIPMVGICRGAQFLCVMAKGKLVQHMEGHHTTHNIRTIDGRLISVYCTHHQMQLPPKDATILAWSVPKLSKIYEGCSQQPEKEVECVYYPSINAVGIQYHPEVMETNSAGFRYCEQLTEMLLSGKIENYLNK